MKCIVRESFVREGLGIRDNGGGGLYTTATGAVPERILCPVRAA
jgi:hypothetical protein